MTMMLKILNDTTSSTCNVKLFTIVKLTNVLVTKTYTTETAGSSSYGAITITGKVDGKEVKIRTLVLYDRTGTYEVDSTKRVLASNFDNQTIDVIGIVEKFNDDYQVKLLSMDDVIFREIDA